MPRFQLLFATAIATCAFAAPALASGPLGSFTQLAGSAGCITDDGTSNGVAGQCADGRGLEQAEAIVLSPDGRFAYTTSYGTGAIAILSVDPATGALSQANDATACVGPTSISGACTDGRLAGTSSDTAHAIAISPDGAFLFAAGRNQSMIGVFQRNQATGALTEVAGSDGCVSWNGDDADASASPGCSTFAPLDWPQSLAISPDGKFVYAGGNSSATALTIYSVGPTGALTPLPDPDGCVTPTATAGCTVARYAGPFFDIALSPDGGTLYGISTGHNAVVAFARDAGTGKVMQIAGTGGCVYNGGAGPDDPCTVGHGLAGVQSVEVSPDGKLVTVGTDGDNSVAVLHRDPATGELSQSAGSAGCVSQETPAHGCGPSRTTGDVYRTLFTPDSRTLLVAAYAFGTPEESGISVFDVAADGTLTQRPGALGCYSDAGLDSTGTAGGCTTARGAGGPVGFALSPDGVSLYASAYSDGGVAAFRLETAPTCADASASTAFGTAIAVPVSCTDVNGDTVTLAGVDGPAHGSLTFSGLSATYTPAAGFSGDDSFRVKGNDGANDGAPATVTVHVAAADAPLPPSPPSPPVVVAAKTTPTKLSLSAKPTRDRKLPFKFTLSGKLTLPAGVSAAQGCSGKVALTVKRGKTTVFKKSVNVSSSCTWKVVASFKNRKKLDKRRSGTLAATARFGGNAALDAKSAKALTLRYG